MPELTAELKEQLKAVVDHFDKEDAAARERQIKVWRRLKFLWDNLEHTYYDNVAHDWRIPDSGQINDQEYYDKPVNVFRAYLESIIAALSITVPPVTCYPDDADNPLDITTAKAGDKIASLLFKHNKAPLLWLHALFVYCTEGMTASYSYVKADKKFGTYENPIYEDTTEQENHFTCDACGADVTESVTDPFVPILCPSCGATSNVTSEVKEVTKQVLKEIQHLPKKRVCMDVFGGLYVKVPIYARKQDDCLYLIWSYETHFANVLAEYPDLRDKIKGGGSYDKYEQYGRLSTQYRGEYPSNNVTVRNCWLRPAAFNVLEDEKSKKLAKEFPDGVKVVLVNDFVADAVAENLDDCWTLTYNPLSDYIYFDPLGLLLTSIQEITNDIISLTIQTMEHGIPQTFASPKVLDFKSYREQEVIPGGVYPANALAGKPLSDGFYEVKTATLSGEVLPFANKVQELGQIVSGALPSLFGGQVSGSRTASEYSMSRAQALQRLQNTWKTLIEWWAETFFKAIPMFIENAKGDERDVQRDQIGNFINVFIRKSELEGKIGKVLVEANENLPLTWSQQKDVAMQLFELNNEKILEVIASPENLPVIRRMFGLTELHVPGEDDRTKQYEEIVQLVSSDPLTIPAQTDEMGNPIVDPMTQMPMQDEEIPSVEVDADVDNHAIHADICRRWLIGDAGRMCKTDNPTGYKNVLLHMKMHKDIMMQEMMAQQAQMSAAMPAEPNNNDGAAPKGDQNESAVNE
jgi:hypothetical protein